MARFVATHAHVLMVPAAAPRAPENGRPLTPSAPVTLYVHPRARSSSKMKSLIIAAGAGLAAAHTR
jgi:hypothetical protein